MDWLKETFFFSVYFKTGHQRHAFTQAGLLGQRVAVLRVRKAAR